MLRCGSRSQTCGLSAHPAGRRFRDPGAWCICFWLFVVCVALSGTASADGINGNIELGYSHSTQTVTSGTEKTDTSGDIFLQRYRINLSRTIYPNLVLSAGGLFDQTRTWSTINDMTSSTDTKSTDTKVSPYVDLKLGTPFIFAGAGYNRLREKAEMDDVSTPAQIRETYNAFLGLRPEGLPLVNFIFTRNSTHDDQGIIQDVVDDSYLLSVKYKPRPELDIFYTGLYDESNDRLKGLKTQTLTNSANVSYSREFFGRTNLSTSYVGSFRQTKVISAGTGTVSSQIFPFAGLSSITDTPISIALDPNPALIDGDLTAGSGINIGPVSVGGNDKPRNIGLDFFNVTEVNTLYVWVDRQLPAVVSNSFSWAIYTSSDNLNWTLFQTVAPAPFGTFENRFEISFPSVKTRYIKVVVKPLSPGIVPPIGFDVSSIFVTEMQAFLTAPAAGMQSRTTDYSHLYSLDVRTRILDRPYLLHDLSFWGSWTNRGESTYVLSNSLTASQRLSRIFSASARVGLDNSKTGKLSTTSFSYGATLNANPLPTLGSTLVASGRVDEDNNGTTTTEGVTLTNWAELYQGINISFYGGLSRGSNPDGAEIRGSTGGAGLNLVPRKNLTINADYNINNSDKTGGTSPDSKNDQRSMSVSVSYVPFDSLYLFGTVSRITQTDIEPSTTQSYTVSWSPLRGGTLQINMAYTQELRSTDNAKVTSYGPSIRWNITPRSSLDLSYGVTDESSLAAGIAGVPSVPQDTKTKSFSAFFRTSF